MISKLHFSQKGKYLYCIFYTYYWYLLNFCWFNEALFWAELAGL